MPGMARREPFSALRVLPLLAWAIAAGAAAEAADPPPPNVILFLTDDQGWTGTSVRSDPQRADSKSGYYQTPRLEAFAAQGMRFSRGYAAAPNCSPTRASIQTGKSPAQLHMTDIIDRPPEPPPDASRTRAGPGRSIFPPPTLKELPREEITIAEWIKRAHPQYTTAHFGKWHLGASGPGEQGYDEHDGDTGNEGPAEFEDPNPKDIFGITERSIAFLEQRAKDDRPFFMQISHYAVHKHIRALGATIERTKQRRAGHFHTNPGYAAMTEDLDTGFGRVLAALDDLGLSDSTYVIYTSDNGGLVRRRAMHTTNLPLARGKPELWEGGIRVPLLVRGPGIPAGSHSDALAISWDFFPTIADWLEIDAPPPPGVEGGSLRRVLEGGPPIVERPRDALVWHFPHYLVPRRAIPHSAIQLDGLKLIALHDSGRTLLYDLAADIGEHENLAKERSEEAAELARRLGEYLAEIDAPMVSPNPEFEARWQEHVRRLEKKRKKKHGR